MNKYLLLFGLVGCLLISVFVFAAEENPPIVSDSWLNGAVENIKQGEYKPSLQEKDYKGDIFETPRCHFVNRSQNLRAYIDEDGLELLPRVIENEGWNLKIKTNELEAVIKGNNIECEGEDIKIVNSNSEDGIQQKIIIDKGSETGKIDFIIETENLEITSEEDKFVLNGGNQEIIYRIVSIKDVYGKDISYSLSIEEEKLSILMSDRSMFFPIEITCSISSSNLSVESPHENLYPGLSGSYRGLSSSPNWTAESDQEHAYFGSSVSTAGDVNNDGYSDVIVGAPYYDNGQNNEGRAYVYYGSSGGLSDSPNWMVESNQEMALLGNSVSTAGDVNGDGYSDIIIGAYLYDKPEEDEGIVYVYYGDNLGLSDSPAWTAVGSKENAQFGSRVSTAGDVDGDGFSDVIVSAAFYYKEQAEFVPRVYLYSGSSEGLPGSPDWTVETSQVNSHFGNSISSAGDVNGDGYSDVIIGANAYDNGEDNEGMAFLYNGSSEGLSVSYSWKAEGNQEGAEFGHCVSSAGDINGDGYSDVIVNAPLYDTEQDGHGKVFVYHGSSSGLSTSPNWTDETDQAGARFGWSVSSAGDVNGDGCSDVILSAVFYDNDQTDEGRVYLYYGNSSGLSDSPNWAVESNQVLAWFGGDVSTAGDVNGDGYSDVIVGSSYYSNDETREGRAFVYYGEPDGLSTVPGWSAEGDEFEGYFGFSVSTAGDVNGDGYADVIIGAPEYDNGHQNEGAVFLYKGSSEGLPASPDWISEFDVEVHYFGQSVSTAGDVNNDGFSDIIAGGSYSNGESSESAVFAYYGNSAGLSEFPDWYVGANQSNSYFGRSISSAGDVNGDGYSDIIIGAPYYDAEDWNDGCAFVYYGGSEGLADTAAWQVSGQIDALYGGSVSGAGDVNGDGFSDIIVGSPHYNGGNPYEGAAFVYFGSSGGLSTSPDWSYEPDVSPTYFGGSVSSAGDVNNDGYSDIIIGATGYGSPGLSVGGAFVFYGSFRRGPSLSPDWLARGDQQGSSFGASVSGAGDVNGDGCSDVIVGASMYSNPEEEEGRVFVYYGDTLGLPTSYDWSAESDQEYASFGRSISTAGDVNGDGCSDIIVGAPHYDAEEDDAGRAVVYYGGIESSSGVLASPQTEEYSGAIAVSGLDINEKEYIGKGMLRGSVSGRAFIPRQYTLDGSRLVQLGNSTGSSGVRISLLGKTPLGRGKVKLQWEVKELGELFDGTSLFESDTWYETDTVDVEISEDVTNLSGGTAYHWRARLKFDPVTYNGLLYTRWFSVGPNGWNETDFITTSMSGIGDQTDASVDLQLSVFPSISIGAFSIRFSVSEDEEEDVISLKVYNKAGIMVKNLFTGKKAAGTHTIKWGGNNSLDKSLPNDVYFISLKKGTEKGFVKKIVVLR